MADKSVARQTLDKARLLLDLAERQTVEERDAFRTLFEAAIVFARTVTFHLQKEYAHQAGFKDWYSVHQKSLGADSLSRFILDARNFILKEGPQPITRHIMAEVHATVRVVVGMDAVIIRAQPWFRRTPKVLWADMIHVARRIVTKWRRQRERRRVQKPEREQVARVTQTWKFDDPDWDDRPALDLVREYLDKLQLIVMEAEGRFGIMPFVNPR